MKRLLFAGLVAATAMAAALNSRADTFAFMGTGAGDFGTLDLTTGVFSLQGNFGLTLAGLAYNGSTLYGVSYNNGSALYTVNPSNGTLTFVGNSGITYDDFGSTSTGLYAVSTSSNLYSINPATGAATLIGATGVSLSGFRSLSDNGSALYFASGTNIYTLNTSTGVATLLGGTGGAGIGAMAFINGTLYAGQDAPDIRVDTLNQANGTATAGAAVTGTSGQFYALAPVPEPSTWLLLVAGLSFTALRRRRKQGS